MAEKEIPIIDQIMQIKDTAKLIKALASDVDYIANATKNQDEYDGKHKVLERQDKKIGKDDTAKTIPVARLITTFQKVITNLAVAFLAGRAVKYILKSEENTEDAFNSILDVYDENKIEYFDRQLIRTNMIETRCAELWYAQKNDDKKPNDPDYAPASVGVMLLTYKDGFQIFPHWDKYGKMDAFTIIYTTDIFDEKDQAVKAQERVDIYTKKEFYFLFKEGGGYKELSRTTNPYGKIPIVYYEQEKSEWADVQSLIDRYETLISNHADENDYYAAPLIKIKGKLIQMPDKTQTGKLLHFAGVASPDQSKIEYGDAEYLTWDQEPESLKLEINNLKDLIYTLSSTPDISFSSVKGITSLSGIALKMLFFDALLKSMNHQEIFGEGFARRLNVVKAILGFTTVKMKASLDIVQATPEFQDPTPQDIKEAISMLSEAVSGKPIMSEQTAVRNNPYVTDSASEIEQMELDKKSENNLGAESFNL